MDTPFEIAWQLSLIEEGVEDRIPYIIQSLKSKKSPVKDWSDNKIDNLVNEIIECDPTESGAYSEYIARQIKFNNIAWPEDSVRMRDTLVFLEKIKRSGSLKRLWVQDFDIDHNKFRNWRKLEDAVYEFKEKHEEEGEELTGERERKRIQKEGAEKIFEMEIPSKYGNHIVDIYKITTPEACVIYGAGSRWCTTTLSSHVPGFSNLPYMKRGDKEGYPATAASYLVQGPLYIIYINKKPYIQANYNFSQFMNTEDKPLKTCSPHLDYILGKFSATIDDKTIINNINRLRAKCEKNYKSRPPFVE